VRLTVYLDRAAPSHFTLRRSITTHAAKLHKKDLDVILHGFDVLLNGFNQLGIETSQIQP
jgi:hypothetical protein